MSYLSVQCSAETVLPTARWLAVLSPLSEWCDPCFGVLPPYLQLCFEGAEHSSSLPQSKLVALEVAADCVQHIAVVHVAAALADELVP